jgi:hypothetical protein
MNMDKIKIKNYNNILILFAIGMFSMLFACQSNMKVMGHFPTSDATNMSRNIPIQVTFSRVIDESSLTDSSVLLQKVTKTSKPKKDTTENKNKEGNATTTDNSTKEQTIETKTELGTPIKGTIMLSSVNNDKDKNIILFYPSMLLDPKTTYQITIGTNVKSTEGTLMGSDYTFKFTTLDESIESNPPSIAEINVKDGDTLKLNVPIIVVFSKPVDPSIAKDALKAYTMKTITNTSGRSEETPTDIKIKPYLIEYVKFDDLNKTPRFTKYIYRPEKNEWDAGENWFFIDIYRVPISGKTMFKVENTLDKDISGVTKIAPTSYLEEGEILPKYDPFTKSQITESTK